MHETSARSDKIRHLVSRYRPDKKAEEADTIQTIRALYERRLNKGGLSPGYAAPCRLRGPNCRAAGGASLRSSEEIGHLRIAHLMEIAIVEADRHEPDRRFQAHRLVDFLT